VTALSQCVDVLEAFIASKTNDKHLLLELSSKQSPCY